MSTPPKYPKTAARNWAWIWFGTVVGVSLIATSAKFQAPTLDLATALDVGQTTFGLFSLIQWVMLVVLGVLLVVGGRAPNLLVYVAIGIGLILIVQAIWILPALNDRVAIVMGGGDLEPSFIHTFFALVEGTKLLLLAVIGLGGRIQTIGPLSKRFGE